MGEQIDIASTAFEDWRGAEAAYAELLATFGRDGPPPTAQKDSALDLARARSRADRARDRYFRRALA